MKLPEKVDQETYWLWMVLLVIGHLALGVAAAAGVKAMGGADTVVVIAIAMLLARRFHAIGWRPWIGGSFVIATMVGAPLAVTGYAIAKNLPMSGFLALMNLVGAVSGVANLALLVVAGIMPDIAMPDVAMPDVATADIAPVAAGADALPPTEAGSQPSLVGTRGSNVFAISAAAVMLVVICAGTIFIVMSRSRAPVAMPQASTPQAPMPAVIPQVQTATPSAPRPAARTESNGLTKDTNDFLRQLSQQRR